jgi:flavin reductase (DIM6/NTAB) family NADH-FMN oxidoreductase RutF
MQKGVTTVDSQAYIAAMGRHVSSVCIIAAEHGGKRHGLTATAVVSITAEPPRLLVAVNKNGHSHRAISQSKAFCVNVLAESQQQIAMVFAGMLGSDADRFKSGEWSTMATGSPALKGAVAVFDCVLAEQVEQSSHTLFFGDVVAVSSDMRHEPLLYGSRRFRNLARPGQQAGPTASPLDIL